MKLEEFFAKVKQKKSDPSLHDRKKMLEVGTILLNGQFIDNIDQRSFRFITDGLKAGLESRTNFVQILCGTLLYHLSKDVRHLSRITKSLLNRSESIAYDVANLNALTSLIFNAPDKSRNAISKVFSRTLQRDIFIQIVGKIKALINKHQIQYSGPEKKTDRVVILIQQFLRPPHAPTKDALEFARFLIKDFEKEVTIINTCEFNWVANGAIVPPFVANVIKDYSKITSIAYLGHEIGFFQPDTGGFEDETILDCIRAINAFQPELILSVGCRNVLSELYSEKCFSFMYPTAATLPLTMKNYFHTWQKADEHSLRQAEDEGIREYYLFEKHPGFEAPRKSKMLSRNEMKIPESAFVFAVVGMRLQNVVDDAFLDMIEEVVDESAAHILFVGHFDSYEAVVGSRDRLTGRCTYAGFQNDIMSVYEICDAYINPKQPGGGSAIVYAMAAGLPALSLPYGDGGLAVEKLPEIVDCRALARVARTLCHDDALCDRYKTMTKEISMELSSRGPLVNKIMEAFSAYREGSLRSQVMVDR